MPISKDSLLAQVARLHMHDLTSGKKMSVIKFLIVYLELQLK